MPIESQFDLVIIGGGINGAALARDAALRDLKVLLLEANDFASGASGHNGRMIHGGLRYLETAQIGLVLEALKERATLLRIAPHIVRPSTLLIPRHQGRGRPGWMVRLGLVALDVLAMGSARRHARLGPAEALRRVPALRSDTLRGAFVMHDAFAECAERLTIENLVDAAALGADLRNRCRVTEVSPAPTGGLRVRWAGPQGPGVADARAVVNATGAWTDETLAVATGSGARMVTKAMGSFMVLRSFAGAPDEAVFFESGSDGRPIIMAPWLGNLLVGTTDRVIEGPTDDAQTSAAEIDYMFDAIAQTFDPGRISRSDILYTYCGVRPLPHRPGQSHKITRKHVIYRHPPPLEGMVTVLGGKLSTFRCVAEQVADTVCEMLGSGARRSSTAQRPLPGAVKSGARQVLAGSPLSVLTQERLLGLYGERAVQVLELAARSADLADVIDQETGAIAAELVFAVECEFARSLADILFRRTLLGYRTGRGLQLIDPFRRIARQHLGWATARIDADIKDYEAQLAATDGARFHPAPKHNPEHNAEHTPGQTRLAV